METIKDYFQKNPVELVEIVEQRSCKGIDHLKEYLTEVEKLGGEVCTVST